VERVSDIQKIKDRLVATRIKLLSTVDGLDEARWNWQPGDGRWSARLTLAHVGSAHWSHLEVARRAVAGQTLHLPGFELDAWNNARAAERADWSVAQVLGDLESAQRATFAFMDGLEDSQLEIPGTHPALGEVTVGQVLRVIGLHDNLHRRELLKLLAEMEGPA
jgi:hypothetical protein